MSSEDTSKQPFNRDVLQVERIGTALEFGKVQQIPDDAFHA